MQSNVVQESQMSNSRMIGGLICVENILTGLGFLVFFFFFRSMLPEYSTPENSIISTVTQRVLSVKPLWILSGRGLCHLCF